MNIHKLAYISGETKHRRLESFLKQEWSMLLDSGSGVTKESPSSLDNYRRYDIAVSEPTLKLSYQTNNLSIKSTAIIDDCDDGLKQCEIDKESPPLETMRKLLAYYAQYSRSQDAEIPFVGGWLGYISYDFGLKQEVSPRKNKTGPEVPLIKMGLFQWAIVTDHIKQTTNIYNFGLAEKQWKRIVKKMSRLLAIDQNRGKADQLAPFQLNAPFKSNLTFRQYSSAFNKIRDYIEEGDCYQINLAQNFTAPFKGCIQQGYALLSESNNSPFSAFLNFGKLQILSLSPERFIESHNGIIITQPIKGTLPRDKDPAKDKANAEQLLNSEKDRAENLMIVDLMRNDLSKTAAKGSVKVSELFGLYHFNAVHHLISTIESKLDDRFDNFDILATTLPGGSITGAPKIRAMQIIDELEPFDRGIYCGVIGYIDFKGNMDTNICIRTLVAKDNNLYCWAGGGLVYDSELEKEYKETYDKLERILPILNRNLG